MKRTLVPILSVSAIIIASLCAILRLISLFFFYDDIGYYKIGAPLPIITNILTVLALVAFLVLVLVLIKPDDGVGAPNVIASYASLLPAAALVFIIIRKIIALSSSEEAVDFVSVASIICALVAVAFFVLVFLRKQSSATVYCGLGALVFLFFCWLSVYFDFSSLLNSTQKTLFYVTCATAALFVFNEITAIYGSVKPKFYYFSAFTAIITIASSSIPSLIGAFSGRIKDYSTLGEDVFLFTLLVYASVRLVTLMRAKKKEDFSEKNENF